MREQTKAWTIEVKTWEETERLIALRCLTAPVPLIFSWLFLMFLWISCLSLIFHACPWYFLEFHACPWYFHEFHDRPWYFHEFHDCPWYFLVAATPVATDLPLTTLPPPLPWRVTNCSSDLPGHSMELFLLDRTTAYAPMRIYKDSPQELKYSKYFFGVWLMVEVVWLCFMDGINQNGHVQTDQIHREAEWQNVLNVTLCPLLFFRVSKWSSIINISVLC